MAEFLPFWPKAAVVGDSTPGDVLIFTRALPTNGFTEVVAHLTCDGRIMGTGNSSIVVTPEISNDGANWETRTGDVFNSITTGSTYPTSELKKLTNVAAFMRFRIMLRDLISPGPIGGTIAISAAGRSS